jgi:hypothetical protein
MSELLQGNDNRFRREFGIILPGIDQYEKVIIGALDFRIKAKLQQDFFKEWLEYFMERLK